jgi:[ribosomal protein S18]-alanine N-acetyltransferase
MNAVLSNTSRLLPMTRDAVDAVLSVEQSAYEFPWTRGNFIDSIAADHLCRMLCDSRGHLLGYFVAMPGVDEMHLLNVTVAPAEQGRGHGRALLEVLVQMCEDRGDDELWLEVRPSNERALRIYRRFGFLPRGVRKRYYPAAGGTREDAVVMSIDIGAASRGKLHALE